MWGTQQSGQGWPGNRASAWGAGQNPEKGWVERRCPLGKEVTSPSGKRKTHCQAAAEGGAPGPGTDSVILSLWL